jgi:hypothetical protein
MKDVSVCICRMPGCVYVEGQCVYLSDTRECICRMAGCVYGRCQGVYM